MNASSILQSYQHFGVHLGLERINQLLEKLDNPHQKIPIIHIAGTNGKGSVCAYLSSILTEAGYRVGRYTSPHLIDWTERICINQKLISRTELQEYLQRVIAATQNHSETPTQFEIITATAWLYFAEQKADIAVIETGLGGRLDATNVCDNPLASVITSISLEHWQILGPTLADIAGEKAGILKAKCPAIIGELPQEAKMTIEKRIQKLDCPATWVKPATDLGQGWAEYELNLTSCTILSNRQDACSTKDEFDCGTGILPVHKELIENAKISQLNPNTVKIRYKLPLLGKIQLMNSAIAIATIQTLQNRGWQISESAIQNGIAKTQWPGRLQQTTWKNQTILIDGAHNPAAAIALREYVGNFSNYQPINWVIGILATKDCDDILKALLKKGDRLYLVPVPDQNSTPPAELAAIAQTVCPELTLCQTFPDLTTALDTAVADNNNLTVLCGSLYLVGHFLQQQKCQL